MSTAPDNAKKSNVSVDINTENGYNNKRGENYAATDEFRRLQEESKGMDDKQKQLFHSGDRQIDETLRERLSRILSRQVGAVCGRNGNANGLLRLNSKGNRFNIYENVNGNLFRDCFEIARNYLKNGELVDLHGVNTTDDGIGYNDCFNYLSEDGLSGFSITPDGDLISVFNASGKPGFLRAIAPIVKEKAKTLDCYVSEKQNLMGMYEHAFGFKTASVMDYNMEYDHDSIAENHGNPQVAFMVNTDAEVETKYFTKDQYDEAKEYRDGFVKSESADSSESASFMPENESVLPDVSAEDGETDSYEAFTKRYNGTLELTEDQKFIQSICKALGTEAVFENLDRWVTGKDGKRRFFSPDGYFDKATGKIYINTSTNGKHNPLLFVIKHELTHFGEINKNTYDSFVKAVKESKELKAWLEDKTGMKGETVDIMTAKLGADIRDERSKYGIDVGVAESEQEVIANFAGDILFAKSGKTLDSLLNSVEAKQRPKVIQAVVDFFRWLREKLSGNKDLTFQLQRLESKYSATLKSVQNAAENTNSTAEGGKEYSFKGYAEDGKGKYESNFPKGTPKAAKAEKILQYIQNVWSKKPIRLKITENAETRYIEAKFDPTYDESGNTPTDASKLMGGNRHGTSSEQRVTLDLADDYYKIASESQYNYSKDETGKDNPAHKDVVKWHYFINDIYFAEYGSNDYAPYRVSINVKERADGDFVYSFSAEKQRELNTPRTLHAVVNDGENSNANVQLSDNRVAQNEPPVNSNSMQETRELLKYYFCFVCLVCYPSKTECNHTAGVDVILSKKGM